MPPTLNGKALYLCLTSILAVATLAAAPVLPAGKTAPPAPYHVAVTPLLRQVN